jgi:hypothetical protein
MYTTTELYRGPLAPGTPQSTRPESNPTAATGAEVATPLRRVPGGATRYLKKCNGFHPAALSLCRQDVNEDSCCWREGVYRLIAVFGGHSQAWIAKGRLRGLLGRRRGGQPPRAVRKP